MGKVTTPTYRVEMSYRNSLERAAWEIKHNGWPSIDNLERYVMRQTVSTYPGFINEHIGKAVGLRMPFLAKIIRQSTGEIIAVWKAGMFQVLPNGADYPEVARQIV